LASFEISSPATVTSETPKGLVDFSRLAREIVARFNKIGQKHGIFQSIEMLDAFRYGKINQPKGAY
jgi:hypothetical protein